MRISGNGQTDKGKIIGVSLVKCSGKTASGVNCFSSSQIATYLQSRKIAILYNRVRYDHLENRKDSVVREAELHWIPINSLFS